MNNVVHARLSYNQQSNVRCWNHYSVVSYPANWATRPEYANFRNAEGLLCGYVEIDGPAGKYLTTTVY